MAAPQTKWRSLAALLTTPVAVAAGIGFSFLISTDERSFVTIFVTILGAAAGAWGLWRSISGLQSESKAYARNIARRDNDLLVDFELGPIKFRSKRSALKGVDDKPSAPIGPVDLEPATAIDFSTPDKLFQVSRQRLLDEAVRIDAISRRNLGIGIIFSVIALGVLAWPLVSQSFFPAPEPSDFKFTSWTMRYYLPRFSVGVLLQFVGFFFLRLYVANELDLKHNKNELTNIEMKMMGLQLARVFDDPSSKKEIMKSLAQTERNFILKKNEKSVSTEALAEYNDIRGLIEKLINKIPGTGKAKQG